MRSRLFLFIACLLLLGASGSAAGAGDDYPAAYKSGDPATQSDRWGYAVRTAPSFVAWRLEQRGIAAPSNYGWGVMVQSGWSVPMLQELAAQLGGRIDQAPAPGAIALWPGDGTWWSHTEWVLAVNPDGTTVNETYFPAQGYVAQTVSRAPWFIHLPAPVGPPGGGGVVGNPDPGTPQPQPPVTPRTTRQTMGVFAFSRHQLVLRTRLNRARLVTITIAGKGRRTTIRRVIQPHARLTRLRVRPKLPQGRYVVTLQSAADGLGPALTLRARARKTA